MRIIISSDGKIDWRSIIPVTVGEKTLPLFSEPTKILNSKELNEFEKANILQALKVTRWKISGKKGAAELLQLPPTTLTSKMKSFGIERPI